MKFTQHLSAHLTPEWRKQYIDYESLKEFLYRALEDFEQLPVVSPTTVHAHFNECDEIFFEMLDVELDKVNNFYSEKLAESKRKYAVLRNELDAFKDAQETTRSGLYFTSSNNNQRKNLNINISKASRPSSAFEFGSRQSLCEVKIPQGQINDMDTLRRRRTTIQLKNAQKIQSGLTDNLGSRRSKPSPKLHDLKLAFSEFYLNLVLLQNYQSLNFTGFRKILKKHDKLFQRANGLEWHKTVVCKTNFYIDDIVDEMISEVENIFTNELEKGDRSKAMKRLRVPPLAGQINTSAVFRFGLFVGVFFVEVAAIIFALVYLDKLPFSWPAFRVYRSCFLVAFYICLLAMNLYGWRSSGVNHVLIFEIDPREHLDHFQMLEFGCFFFDLWGASVIFYLFSAKMNIPQYVPPFVLVTLLLAYTVQPFPCFHSKARIWLLRIFGRVLRSPFAHVNFPDFFMADQLNSLAFMFPDLAFFLCFYGKWIDWPSMQIKQSMRNLTHTPTGNNPYFAPKTDCDGVLFGLSPLLQTLPAWFRFAQCLRRYRDLTLKTPVPHLLNAGKYSTTFFVAFFSTWLQLNPTPFTLAITVLVSFTSSMCTYSWDIIMDWGLLDRKAKENPGLRDELVYRFRAYYYIGILEDFIIRMAWVFKLAFKNAKVIELEVVVSLTYLAEVFRRIIWNFFRLENEHLNNCGEFRAVRDIFVVPIPKSDVDVDKQSNNRAKVRNYTGVAHATLPYYKSRDHLVSSQDEHIFLHDNGDDVVANSLQNNSSTVILMERGGESLLTVQAQTRSPRLPLNHATLTRSDSKSLWHYIRDKYDRGKVERRRRQGLEMVSTMETALRAADDRPGIAVLSPQKVTEEKKLKAFSRSSKEDADSYFSDWDFEMENLGTYIPIGNAATVMDKRLRNRRRRHEVVVDGTSRQASVRGTIPLTVCMLETGKQLLAGSSNKSSVVAGAEPKKMPGILVPHKGQPNTRPSQKGWDLVIDPTFFDNSDFESDDSPTATALPTKTLFLARQLRQILRQFAETAEAQSQVSTSGKQPESTALPPSYSFTPDSLSPLATMNASVESSARETLVAPPSAAEGYVAVTDGRGDRGILPISDRSRRFPPRRASHSLCTLESLNISAEPSTSTSSVSSSQATTNNRLSCYPVIERTPSKFTVLPVDGISESPTDVSVLSTKKNVIAPRDFYWTPYGDRNSLPLQSSSNYPNTTR